MKWLKEFPRPEKPTYYFAKFIGNKGFFVVRIMYIKTYEKYIAQHAGSDDFSTEVDLHDCEFQVAVPQE